jgi:hypothetical protein
VAALDLDQAARLEHAERVADDRPADAELLAELDLGRKPPARGEAAVEDPRLEDVEDAVAQARRAEVRKRRRACGQRACPVAAPTPMRWEYE